MAEPDWSVAREYGETVEYALSTSVAPFILAVWGDRTWATLFEREPAGDPGRELADFVADGSDAIAAALERVGVPKQAATVLALGVWQDVSSRRAAG
jgi:hypothetical protein